MIRTRQSFLNDNLCKRYAERGVAIDQAIQLLAALVESESSLSHRQDCPALLWWQTTHNITGEMPSCTCPAGRVLAELRRVADPQPENQSKGDL